MNPAVIKGGIIGLAGAMWAGAGWLIAQASGDGGASIAPLIISGVTGAGVTGIGALAWVKFVTKSMTQMIDRQAQRIQDLEGMLFQGGD